MTAASSILQKTKRQIDLLLPSVLLILAAAFIFITESRSGGFIPGGLYNGVPVHGLTLSKNLMNDEHPLFMYTSREIHNGKEVYNAYNRFPVFPFLLTGLLITPFENDTALQAYIARQLMNIFFFLSIVVVYKLADNFLQNKYMALSIALLTFSSFFMLSYNNIIFNDIPALLGFTIALYAFVSAQKKSFKLSRILFYSIFPISLGWQPYAVYTAWFLSDAFEMLFEKESIKKKIYNLFRRTSFLILASSILFGVCILAFQLFNEWSIVGGSFANLPSVNSGLWRSGLTSSAGHTQYAWTFNWLIYLPQQAHAITVNLIPFWPVFQVEPGLNASIFAAAVLIIYVLLKYYKKRNYFNKVTAVLILSGLFWTIPMKNFVALHEFQSLFYAGFSITLFILLLSLIDTKLWKLLSINITFVFLIAVSLSNELKVPNTGMNRITNQFRDISHNLPAGSRIYFEGDRSRVVKNCKHAVDFFLGHCWFTEKDEAEYIISKNPDSNGVKLTSNTEYNLYKNLPLPKSAFMTSDPDQK